MKQRKIFIKYVIATGNKNFWAPVKHREASQSCSEFLCSDPAWLRCGPASLNKVEIFALTFARKKNDLCISKSQCNPRETQAVTTCNTIHRLILHCAGQRTASTAENICAPEGLLIWSITDTNRWCLWRKEVAINNFVPLQAKVILHRTEVSGKDKDHKFKFHGAM